MDKTERDMKFDETLHLIGILLLAFVIIAPAFVG